MNRASVNRAGDGSVISRRTGQSPSPPGSWGRTLTKLPYLLFSSRTFYTDQKMVSETQPPCPGTERRVQKKTCQKFPESRQPATACGYSRQESRGKRHRLRALDKNLQPQGDGKEHEFSFWHGFTSPEDVDATLEVAISGRHTAGEKLKDVESQIPPTRDSCDRLLFTARPSPSMTD